MTKIRAMRATNPDIALLLTICALLVIGLLAIFSASHVTDGASKVIRQSLWAGVGLLGMGFLTYVDYRTWMRSAFFVYGVMLLMLVATLFTHPINGAHSWFTFHRISIQPSEFAKLVLIIAFATLLVRYGERLNTPEPFLRSLGFFMLPVGLVLIQPDFGTAMTMCAIWFFMLWTANVRWWILGGLCLCALLLLLVAWQGNLLKDYQKQRLDFIHADPEGSGYHQRQAYIAIGAGQLWGKGYLHGSQARRGFLPEQDTDFVFATIGEEFGFLGTLVVLGLFVFLIFRLVRIADGAETPFGRLIVIGVAALLATHVIINIGMCLTLMPVTGVPLPLISYGGSNLLTTLFCLGIILNVSRYHQSYRTWAGPEDPLLRDPLPAMLNK